MNRGVCSAFLLLLTACGEPFVPFEDTPFLESLPETDDVLLEDVDTTSSKLREDCVPSQLLPFSTQMSNNVNGITDRLLGLLDKIRSRPITTRAGDTRIWGPYQVDENMALKLTMTYDGQAYQYVIEIGGLASTVADVVMRGEIQVDPERAERSGAFSFNFDTWYNYQPESDHHGSIQVQYHRYEGGREIYADLNDVRGGDTPYGAGLTAQVDYHSDGGGVWLDFWDKYNLTGSQTSESRWLETWSDLSGAGMGSVEISEGDLGSKKSQFTECWDTARCQVFSEQITPNGDITTVGDNTLCPQFQEPR